MCAHAVRVLSTQTFTKIKGQPSRRWQAPDNSLGCHIGATRQPEEGGFRLILSSSTPVRLNISLTRLPPRQHNNFGAPTSLKEPCAISPTAGHKRVATNEKLDIRLFRLGRTMSGQTHSAIIRALSKSKNVKIRPSSGRFRSPPKSITERRAREPRVQHADGDQSECRLATVCTGSAPQ